VVYAASGDFDPGSSFLSVVAVAVMAAAAALIVGGIVGFLFALPRTLERDSATGVLATNSNLDQVSDWLTKILVGLGLIQLGAIADGVDGLGTSVASALGDGPSAQTFALSVLIYASVDGFIVAYLWTRLVLSRQLKDAAENLAKASELGDVIAATPPPVRPPEPLRPPPGMSSPNASAAPEEASE
jgi:hypothetical protein